MMKKPTFLPTFLRSMFYQANWNVYNMQGTGFLWLIKDLFHRNHKNFSETFFKNNKPFYFNTNPYFITLILGIILKEYEDGKELDDYSKTYASAFAALGDSFFWHSLRPFALLLSLCAALLNVNFAIISYLVLYNIFHIWFRFFGFYFGYNFGKNVILVFKKIAFSKWTQIFDSFSTFIAGFSIAAAVKYISGGSYLYASKAVLLFLIGFFIARIVKIPIGFMCMAGILGFMLILGITI